MTESPIMSPLLRQGGNLYEKSRAVSRANAVYHAIKSRVIAYDFPQGRRIIMERLAEKNGVSTWPVREAMKRLAAEGLVIKAPRKGFIALTLSESRLMNQYELTRNLLLRALETLDDTARQKLSENEPVAEVLHKLNRRVLSDPATLASYSGEVFCRIALLSENAELVHAIDHANDHLYFIRTLECQRLENTQTELIRLCELLLAGRCETLELCLQDYHDQRVVLLPALMEFLRR